MTPQEKLKEIKETFREPYFDLHSSDLERIEWLFSRVKQLEKAIEKAINLDDESFGTGACYVPDLHKALETMP